MSISQTLEAEASCRALLHRFFVALDSKDFGACVQVFAADLVWRRPGQDPMRGVEQARAFLENLEAQRRTSERPDGIRQRHLVTTSHIDVTSEDEARGVSYALVYRDETPNGGASPLADADLLVEYHDVFKRVGGAWRIAEREARHVFKR